MTKDEQDEIWEELSQNFSWCIHGDDYFFDEERFMTNKEDYIIIRKPKEDEK